MNEQLLDSFRHNSWATKHLVQFCRPLTEEQLTTPGIGTFGGILATLNHIVSCDGSYVSRLVQVRLGWVDGDDTTDFDRLEAWVDDAAALWEKVLAEPIDTEAVIVVDNGTNATRHGTIASRCAPF